MQCLQKSCSKHLGGGGDRTSFALTTDFIEDVVPLLGGNDGPVVQGEIMELGY